jgi:hypothetical protein
VSAAPARTPSHANPLIGRMLAGNVIGASRGRGTAYCATGARSRRAAPARRWYTGHTLEPHRFRTYLPRERAYVGYVGHRVSRAEFARMSGIPQSTIKSWELHGRKPSAKARALLAKCQEITGGMNQGELLDHKAEKAAARAAEKLAAAKARALDVMLDAAMKTARKPMKKSARQASIF